ncbi:MAG: (d)CMP kinase [bacterium]
MNHILAIDGPSGAGKSTVARCLGRKLHFLHVDSGALYRIMTWQALDNGIDTQSEPALTEFAARVKVDFAVRDGAVVYAVAGVEPGDRIRTPTINQHASLVAKVPAVRTRVTNWLRELRKLDSLVVEGRDIGSVVFPDSPARFYLDAAPEERARRRHTEEQQKGIETAGTDAVLASLLNRDRIDSSRAVAPLKVADGAMVLDTTRLSIEQVVQAVYDHLPEDWRLLNRAPCGPVSAP